MSVGDGGVASSTSPLDESTLRAVVARWIEQHALAVPGPIALVDVEVLVPSRPCLVDVVAEVGGRLVHPVLSLRSPGDEPRMIGTVEEASLGTVEDATGETVVLDALHDAQAARALLDVVVGPSTPRGHGRRATAGIAGEGTVSVSRADERAMTLAFDHDVSLTVFRSLYKTPHPGVALLAGLDEAGFNHLAAPVAFWRRSGMDLGLVQEVLAGPSSGWAFALASLRDLIASRSAPQDAGGDFAPEALSLGTMTARMHLALERAFGHREAGGGGRVDTERARGWAGRARGVARRGGSEHGAPGPGGVEMRTHGDYQLVKVARTDHGWVLSDPMPGGGETRSGEPLLRSPLEDVADFTWSLHQVAAAAAAERGPGPVPLRLGELVGAWEERNRRAFVSAYLAAPGIGALLPSSRRLVRAALSGFERDRAQSR